MRMAILAFLVACGGQEETQAPAQITPIEPPETFPEPVPDEPGDEVFAMYERIVEEVANPSPLESGTANAETHAVKRLVWKAGTATYQEQLCATWANEVFGTLWSFPPGFVDRQPVVERSVRSSDEGFDFEGGPHIDLLGTDVSEGRLPTEPDDAGVIDEDADGKPGVTVLIDNNLLGSGEVYVVQRSTSRLRGLWGRRRANHRQWRGPRRGRAKHVGCHHVVAAYRRGSRQRAAPRRELLRVYQGRSVDGLRADLRRTRRARHHRTPPVVGRRHASHAPVRTHRPRRPPVLGIDVDDRWVITRWGGAAQRRGCPRDHARGGVRRSGPTPTHPGLATPPHAILDAQRGRPAPRPGQAAPATRRAPRARGRRAGADPRDRRQAPRIQP